jgi:hypothetical protein
LSDECLPSFVQIKVLGSKLALPRGVVDFPYMYIAKTFKKPKEQELLKNRKSKSLNIWHETSSSECLSSLFKLKPWGQN